MTEPDVAPGRLHEHLEYQRQAYDHHYPQMATAVRQQREHALFGSFLDRLASLILDLGLPPAGAATGEGRPPVRLYEAGCGEGLLASAVQRAAAERGLEFAYLGSDISAAGLELARPVLAGELRLGDAISITAELPSASQDLVWAKNLLHHLDDPVAFLREASRVVGPQGRVVIIEPRLYCPVHWINCIWFRQERFLWHGYRRTLAAFRQAGVNVLETRPYSWLPYELAFATRFHLPRRLVSTRDPRVVARVTAVDERLMAALPDLSLYRVSVLTAAEAGSADGAAGTNSR